MVSIPRGPEHLNCPFWQKPMCDVCHKCPFWMHLRGTNRNTGEEIDDWGCALGMTPALLIENTQMARETGSAVESFRNEMVRQNTTLGMLLISAAKNAETPMVAIEAPTKDEGG